MCTHELRVRAERKSSPELQEGSNTFPPPGWILPLSLSCQLELLAPKSCAREAEDPVPALGSEACAQAKRNKVEDEPLQGQG